MPLVTWADICPPSGQIHSLLHSRSHMPHLRLRDVPVSVLHTEGRTVSQGTVTGDPWGHSAGDTHTHGTPPPLRVSRTSSHRRWGLSESWRPGRRWAGEGRSGERPGEGAPRAKAQGRTGQRRAQGLAPDGEPKEGEAKAVWLAVLAAEQGVGRREPGRRAWHCCPPRTGGRKQREKGIRGSQGSVPGRWGEGGFRTSVRFPAWMNGDTTEAVVSTRGGWVRSSRPPRQGFGPPARTPPLPPAPLPSSVHLAPSHSPLLRAPLRPEHPTCPPASTHSRCRTRERPGRLLWPPGRPA